MAEYLVGEDDQTLSADSMYSQYNFETPINRTTPGIGVKTLSSRQVLLLEVVLPPPRSSPPARLSESPYTTMMIMHCC